MSRHEGTAIVKDVRKDIDTLLGRLYGEPGTGGGGGGGGAGGASKSRSRIRGADRKGARMEVCARQLVGVVCATAFVGLVCYVK